MMRTQIEARNSARVAGEPFRDSVELKGYENQSVWGCDETTGHYWASLWPNAAPLDTAPEASLGWSGQELRRPECLLVTLCDHLQSDPLTIARALGLLRPDLRLRDVPEVEERLRQAMSSSDSYGEGMATALGWVVGSSRQCPASGWPCHPGFRPGPEHAYAEVLYTSGQIFLGRGDRRLSGVDDALGWATRLAE